MYVKQHYRLKIRRGTYLLEVVRDLPHSRLLVSCTQSLLSRSHPGRDSATVLKMGVFASRVSKKNLGPPTFHLLHTWGTHCTVFIIVIMTSKHLPAANNIT